MYDIPFAKASIGHKELAYASDAAANGWGKKCYEYIIKFEQAFATYLGVDYSIATSSCTGALHILMRALGIGAGDEVILPEVTWIASVSPVIYEKATPVFVDIDKRSWCIDPSKVEEAITPRTKAIIAVHLYGNLADLHTLRSIADRHNLYLIEDAAEAIGSEYQGSKAGSVADAGVFSFHGTKTMTTGEGGMLVCKSAEIYERALLQSNHGRKPSKHTIFWMDEVGVKYKMSNIQAAIGLGQIERIEELVERKREIFEYYVRAFSGLEVELNPEDSGDRNSYWLPAVIRKTNFSEIERDALVSVAQEKGISLRPFFYPLTRFPMFSSMPRGKTSGSVSSLGINLPSYHDMTKKDQDVVIDEVKKSFEKN